jgi:hypothetical protein
MCRKLEITFFYVLEQLLWTWYIQKWQNLDSKDITKIYKQSGTDEIV